MFHQRTETYTSKFSGLHEHAEVCPDPADQRGLTTDQKRWVLEAFAIKSHSAKEIIDFFLWKKTIVPLEDVPYRHS